MRLALLLSLTACVRVVPVQTDACEVFSRSVVTFEASLIRSDDAPPRVDPVRSPPLAKELRVAAAACLRARGVEFKEVADGLQFTAGVGEQVRAVYAEAFFLAKPYAAAAFDKSTSVLFLPHAAVLSDAPNFAVLHELEHVKSLAMLRAGPRTRHVMLANASTKPDSLSVDEVFAYAAIAMNEAIEPKRREQSLGNARFYLSMVEAALADPATTAWLEPASSGATLSAEHRARLERLVQCAKSKLPAISSCDEPIDSK